MTIQAQVNEAPVGVSSRVRDAGKRLAIQPAPDVVANKLETWKDSPANFFNHDSCVLRNGAQLCNYVNKIESESSLYRLRRRFIAARLSSCRDSWGYRPEVFLSKLDEESRKWAAKCIDMCREGSFYNALAEEFTAGVFFVLKLSPSEYVIRHVIPISWLTFHQRPNSLRIRLHKYCSDSQRYEGCRSR